MIALTVVALMALLTLATPPRVQAMPQFARQAGIECSMCHTTIPRLTREGYEFRRAGLRFADEIGAVRDWEKKRAEPSYNVANDFSARLQMNGSYLRRDHATDTGGYTADSHTYNSSKMEFKEFTLYPLTGGFLGNWASMSEISGTTDEIEVENAYVRYVKGDADRFCEVRFGVFHPFEGFGASDRPLGLSRPLIQTQAATDGRGTKNGFHPWGYDQAGVEAGVQIHDTSVSLTVFNGLIENAEDPAQGSKLKKAAGSPTENNKDFQLFVNQFIGTSDAAVSAYLYQGYLSNGGENLYQDSFNRYALYVTVPLSVVDVLAGYGGGSEDVSGATKTANSSGGFVEIDGAVQDNIAAGARLDVYDPTDLVADNSLRAVSAFVNAPLNNGIQFIGELRNTTSQHGSDSDQQTTSANLRFIYIW